MAEVLGDRLVTDQTCQTSSHSSSHPVSAQTASASAQPYLKIGCVAGSDTITVAALCPICCTRSLVCPHVCCTLTGAAAALR